MTKLKIAPINIQDSPSVVNFLYSKYDDLGRSLDFWEKRTQFWWQNNPFYKNNLPIGWGIWAEDLLVGYLGCIYTSLKNNEESYTSLNLTCWHVEPEFRASSLDLFFMANSFMPEGIYFNTSPTPKVEKILQASKYKKYINNNNLYCKIIPLHLNDFIVSSKLYLPIKFFRPILKLFDIILNVYIKSYWDHKNIYVTDLNGISNEELINFIEKRKNNELTIERSIKFYQWLLANDDKYYILVARDKISSQILAIGLYNNYEYKKNKILELIDFYSLGDNMYTDKHIIKKMIVQITTQNDTFIKYVAISLTDYSGINLEICPGKRKIRSKNNKYYRTSNIKMQQLLESHNYLFTTQGDMHL